MFSFESVWSSSESNVIRPKCLYQHFNGEFRPNAKFKKNIDSLIYRNEFSTIKEMMENGSKFILTKDNFTRLLKNCHDADFFVILYEKGLLFNFNLIEEAIKLDDVDAIETMVQALAGGWGNHTENGHDFYVKMMAFSIVKNANLKTNAIKYIYSKANRDEQLFVLTLVIYQSFDIGKLNIRAPNTPLLLYSYENDPRWVGTFELEIKILDQLEIYHTLLLDNVSCLFSLMDLINTTHHYGDNNSLNNLISKVGIKILTLKVLIFDLVTTIKLEKNKWYSILNKNTQSKCVNYMLLNSFKTSINDSIKEICQSSEIKNVHLINYPKFTHIARFPLADRLAFLDNFYFCSKLDQFDPNITPRELDLKRISIGEFIVENLYNSMISINCQQPLRYDKSNPKIIFPTSSLSSYALEQISIQILSISSDYAKHFLMEVYKFSKTELNEKYIDEVYNIKHNNFLFKIQPEKEKKEESVNEKKNNLNSENINKLLDEPNQEFSIN
ncbi:hypothetical protein ACTFIR_002911 [Dictyostelium discoideum]